jgi:cation diffusion facilitator family transporter
VSADGSRKVVLAALVGNALISITKFTASAYTGSSAMLSEAIHSVVDTINQGLILYGMARAKKPADDQHPFGYGMELYFWSFIVAILIFAVGAGVSIYEGIEKIGHPEPIKDAYINYIVLGAAFLFEGAAWWVALKEFRKSKGDMGYFEAVRQSKDAAVFTVLFEDTAATLGLVVAFVGIALGQAMDLPVLDGVASVVIGLILASVAAVLAYECKSLLLGEGASNQVVQGIRSIAETEEGVDGVNELRTMHLGPKDVLVNISLDFGDGLSAIDIERLISEMERDIKAAYPEVKRIFVEAQSISGHLRDLSTVDGAAPTDG